MAVDTQAINSNEEYSFSPNTLTAQDYATIQAELAEIEQKLDAAPNEFMYQHYSRLMKAMEVTQEKVSSAKVKLDRRGRTAKRKQKRAQLQARRQK